MQSSTRTPLNENPKSVLKDFVKRVRVKIKEDKISLISASMAYYILFAFFPALSSIVFLYAWFNDPAEISQNLTHLKSFMPEEMISIIQNQLTDLSRKASHSLGLSAIGALLISLWSASKGSSALIVALNIIYHKEDGRGFIKSSLLSLAITFLGALFGILAVSIVTLLPVFLKLFQLGKVVETISMFMSWPILLLLFSLFLSLIYRYAPYRNSSKWKWISSGSSLAVISWAIISLLFSWYVKEFGNYNKTYGSLGAIIILMLWFYLSSFTILLGGVIDAERELHANKNLSSQKDKTISKKDILITETLSDRERPPTHWH